MRQIDPLGLSLDASGIKRRTVHGASATAIAQALKFCLQFGSQIVLARILGPEQFGLIAMVMPVLGLVIALNDFGLGQSIVQRTDITHRQVSALFWLNLAIGAGFTLLAILSAPLVAALYGEPRTMGVTIAASSLVITSSLAIVPMALLNRQMRFVVLATIEVVAMAVGLASGIASAWLGAGYWSLVIMQAVNSTVSLALVWFQCRWLPSRPASEPGVGSMMRVGANIMGSGLAAYISMSANNVIVGAVNGKIALGLYDRSYNLVVKPLGQLMAPIARVAIPLLSRLQDAPERYAKAYLLMLQLTTTACVPGLIATIVIAEPLVLLLFGPKWIAMAPVFVWICIGGIASAVSSSTSWLFVTQNRTDEQIRFNVIAAVIGVASFALGSHWGVVGVARVAALSSLFLQMPLLIWAAARKGPVSLTMLRRGLAPLIVAGIACAVVSIGVMQMISGPRTLLIVGTFVATYAAFCATLLAQPAGRRLMASARALLMPLQAAA